MTCLIYLNLALIMAQRFSMGERSGALGAHWLNNFPNLARHEYVDSGYWLKPQTVDSLMIADEKYRVAA